MSFRRLPFQFSTTDPVERQRELEKRFGLPTRNQMYVDVPNPVSMATGVRDSSASSSSPRLQHRVPIFVEGYDQPVRSSVDSTNSASENKKPNVRVIPIEIEGAETRPSMRHRTFSGPAGLAKEHELLPPKDDPSPLKRSMHDLTKPTKMKATTGPKVYNVPIKVEGGVTGGKSAKLENGRSPVKKEPKTNGCNVSKNVTTSNKEPPVKPEINEEQKSQININNSLQKIENVLEEFKSYEAGVQEFSGTVKDKQYRYLDEMLTRCMLRLDDIDTMGNDKVRAARKSAVKKVQVCIDLLENKVSSLNVNDTAGANGMESNDSFQEMKNISEKDNKIDDVKGTEGDDQVVEKQDTENSIPKGHKPSESTEVTEYTIPQGDSTGNLNVTKLSEKVVGMPSEECKDEMVAESQDTNSEIQIPEIEMIECPSTSFVKPDSTNEVLPDDKNVAESLEVEVPNDDMQESDVEMKEIESMLNDVPEKTLNCDTNQIKDQTVPDVNMEETTAGIVDIGTENTLTDKEQSVLSSEVNSNIPSSQNEDN